MRIFRGLVIVALSGLVFAAHGNAAAPANPALTLLAQAAANYRAVTTFEVVGVVFQQTDGQPDSAITRSPMLLAAVMPDRLRVESSDDKGRVVAVSDGINAWIVHPDLNEFRHRVYPSGQTGVDAERTASAREGMRRGHESWLRHYGTLDQNVTAAHVVRTESIPRGGVALACDVVEVSYGAPPPGVEPTPTLTLWIDRLHHRVQRESTVLGDATGADHVPRLRHEIKDFTLIKLGGELPDSLFTFKPPAGVHEPN